MINFLQPMMQFDLVMMIYDIIMAALSQPIHILNTSFSFFAKFSQYCIISNKKEY